jgi:hypothetical protein
MVETHIFWKMGMIESYCIKCKKKSHIMDESTLNFAAKKFDESKSYDEVKKELLTHRMKPERCHMPQLTSMKGMENNEI